MGSPGTPLVLDMSKSPMSQHLELFAALAAPFENDEVRNRQQGGRQLQYITARTVMNRLDDVLGPENWWDEYQPLEHSVICRLTVKLPDGSTLTKSDAGGYAGMPDSGDDEKSGFSDAFKRAAVKFGIGRYLYRLPHQWADYDPQKRQFAALPRLPDWAVAKAAKAPRPARGPGAGLPTDGPELHRRLREADSDLAAKGLCSIGALLAHVTHAGVKAGFGADLNQWSGPAIELAVAETRAFKSRLASTPETKTAA